MEEQILTILEEITGTDEVRINKDLDLFGEGLLDSLASVQLLVELDGQLDVQVPVSEFDRELWGTPNKIIEQVNELKG
ncbi:D-alanine-poly(phosphoribitol) ligase, subunit 2 [Enterococcus sp. 10A9_DIV0425]|uniref:D-alanyl carrier protein n=1 Tax=Candidatus Enterococcus wittei TaxID=1987383 RepID=A0A242JWC3_9ENTE|nr:D-alanine--poly(phosphoribitol) ligase subunit DltC [Enterococcus sp. 10A9_DIV0425]OTP09618.1 D-alanine-poly(phosphoribitol) ligase, subunit 2 [Enterococcus sp. 10A9_DIV0425]THE15244.1 D-alanine--poly(phosphoribitol) ligase subunit DltC [Enterococcus hirae]